MESMEETKKIERGDLWGSVEKGHRRTRHWLLSTVKTVARVKFRSYGKEPYELDFTLKPKMIRKGSDNLGKQMYARFCQVFFDCVIPNAIIARLCGVLVTASDITTAINQGMRIGNREWFSEAWASYVDAMGGKQWVDSMVQKPLDLYVYGRKENGETIDPYTLERYVRIKVSKYSRKLKLSRYRHTNTPKMNMLLEEYRKDPSIGSMGYVELIKRFGVSNNAIARFKKWMKENA